MALPSNPALFLRLLALVTLAHANIMVETIDGTFVPWSFVRRAGTGPIGIRLTNVNDAAYVVSFDILALYVYHITDHFTDPRFDGLVLSIDALLALIRNYAGNRNSSSTNSNGYLSFSKFHLSSVSSGRRY